MHNELDLRDMERLRRWNAGAQLHGYEQLQHYGKQARPYAKLHRPGSAARYTARCTAGMPGRLGLRRLEHMQRRRTDTLLRRPECMQQHIGKAA
jgi:hypothetical protein